MIELPEEKNFIREVGMHDLIKGCIAIEKTAASIYGTFMQLFPKEKNFWEDLFNDEIDHASFLTDVDSVGIFDELRAAALPLPVQLVEKTFKFAGNMNREINLNPVSFENALKMALKLEETMVEIFTNKAIASLLFSEDKPFAEKILLSERLHVDKIKDMMIKKGFLKLS